MLDTKGLRFPRVSLHQEASALESKINFWMDSTSMKRNESEQLGLDIPARKLNDRLDCLRQARTLCNQLRICLYQCP